MLKKHLRNAVKKWIKDEIANYDIDSRNQSINDLESFSSSLTIFQESYLDSTGSIITTTELRRYGSTISTTTTVTPIFTPRTY